MASHYVCRYVVRYRTDSNIWLEKACTHPGLLQGWKVYPTGFFISAFSGEDCNTSKVYAMTSYGHFFPFAFPSVSVVVVYYFARSRSLRYRNTFHGISWSWKSGKQATWVSPIRCRLTPKVTPIPLKPVAWWDYFSGLIVVTIKTVEKEFDVSATKDSHQDCVHNFNQSHEDDAVTHPDTSCNPIR